MGLWLQWRKVLIKQLVVKLVRTFKNKEFTLDEKISSLDLLYLCVRKFTELARGIIFLRRLAFLGKGVKLSSKKQIVSGRSLVIGDYTYLDGLGDTGIRFGNACSVGRFSNLSVSGSFSDIGKGIEIGDNVGIGDYAHIGGAGGVHIGKDTIIGSFFSVHPENHNISDLDTLIRLQGVNRKGISVGENCWIGAKVTLLDGSVVGKGCVIAAGSVVRGSFPDNVIIGGVPAKILKERVTVNAE
jgi:acetyltransferase-like isoleucine patch superfamily enzyme